MTFMGWKMNKINTTKGMHVKIVRIMMIKTIIRRCKVQDTGRKLINLIHCRA